MVDGLHICADAGRVRDVQCSFWWFKMEYMEKVFESTNLRVIFVPGRGARSAERIVVSFRSMLAGGRNSKDLFPETGESQITIQKSGADALHFIPASNRWYQYPEMSMALAAARSISERYRDVITYGMSMGGFAALQSSGFLNAGRTITYSPQVSVDHRKYKFINSGWQRKMRGAAFVWDDLRNISRTACHYVVYDPLDPDREHIRILRSNVSVQPIVVPFSGHHSWRAVKEAGIGSALLKRLINGESDTAWIRKAIRESRRGNPVYLAKMKEQLDRRRDLHERTAGN